VGQEELLDVGRPCQLRALRGRQMAELARHAGLDLEVG
jgi:hypothetical protein